MYLKEPYNPLTCGEIIYPYTEERYSNTGINKLLMPAKYARYFIEVTGVRCERLREISDEDCLKEGVIEIDCISERHSDLVYENGLNSIKSKRGFLLVQYDTPMQAYAALIDKINRKGTWESNPWVFVYDFKLLKNQ